MVLHCSLQQIHAGKTVDQIFRSQQHNHGRAAADHDRVHEDAECLDKTSLCGAVAFCRSSSARSGAGTGLVGEKSAFYAVHQHSAEAACRHLAQSERFLKNPCKHRWNLTEVDGDDEQGNKEVADCHHRNNKIQHLYRRVFPKNDDRGEDHQHDTGVKRRNGKCIFKRRSHGVADYLTDAAPADQAGNGEQDSRQNVSFFLLETVFNQIVNVVGRTAAVAAVQRIFFFVKLCERSFDKRGRRADDSRHPHPEHSTCASGGDCSDNADQISHTDTRCGGNDQCLKRRKAAFFIFLFRQGTDHVREQTDGKKTCPDRKICQIIKFMDEHYETRRNVVKEQIEFRKIMPALPETELPPFNAVRTKDINTFYINAHINKICCTQADLKAVVDSDYAKPFNPFVHYFTSRKAWNGKTDFIGQMTKTVQAADQAFFEDSFRRWLVGMVACAIDDNVQNHQLMLLHGAQGKGKSTFIRHLLPPELKDYYRNGMIIPENNNHLLQLSSCLLINLDEFDTLSPERMQNLKSLITQDVVNERKVYDIQNYTYIRRASFIASTNNPHCMPDVKENRRILFSTLLNIDYHTPVNHEGIYAQAYALYRQGFQYWYENEEITFLNNRNEAFRQKDPIEENLFFYFRAARQNDIQAQWYPASYLLSVLSMNGRTQANTQTKKMLVTVLESNHFQSRKTSNNITEYWVVEYSAEERKENSIRPQLPVQTGLEL